MTSFGMDISDYQFGLDLGQAKQGGAVFAFAKATEGQHTHSHLYHHWLDQAKSHGYLFSAYHWLHSDSPPANQARNAVDIVGKHVPISIDCERGTHPTLATCRAFRDEVHRLGGTIGFLYLPHFYWLEIGQPSLTGWSVWQALYGSNPVGGPKNLYPGDGSPRWAPVGGVTPTILQFGSQSRWPGYSKDVDVNAFRGNRAELAARGLFVDFATNNPPTPPKPPIPPLKPGQHRARAEAIIPFATAGVKANHGAVRAAYQVILDQAQLLAGVQGANQRAKNVSAKTSE